LNSLYQDIYRTSRFDPDISCVASVLLRSRRLSKHALRHVRQTVSRAWKLTEVLEGHSASSLRAEENYLLFTVKMEPRVSYETLTPMYQIT